MMTLISTLDNVDCAYRYNFNNHCFMIMSSLVFQSSSVNLVSILRPCYRALAILLEMTGIDWSNKTTAASDRANWRHIVDHRTTETKFKSVYPRPRNSLIGYGGAYGASLKP